MSRHADARVAAIVAETATTAKEERILEGFQCPRCASPARALMASPFTRVGIACTRRPSECGFVHELETKPGDSRPMVSAAIVAALAALKPGNAPIKPRSQFDLAGSPDFARQRIAELGDRLGRVHGKTTAIPLSHAAVAEIQRMPFGILQLDLMARGIVLGAVNRIWGPKSTLKTTLCLRALRQAQRRCRHCKHPIVMDPETGSHDCQCPNPRYKLRDEQDYAWLPTEAAVAISDGKLPTGARVVKVKGEGSFSAIACDVPEHVSRAAAEKDEVAEEKAKKKGKKAKAPKKTKVPAKRDIFFTETYRCEPMRCLWLAGEKTVTKLWAIANGVDTALVLLVGGEWAEQCYGDLTEAILTREFDFIVIDSTSVLEPAANLEKPLEERDVVASRATLQGRFIRRYLSASFAGLTSRYTPTILATSQVSTHGIGYGQHAYLAATDGNAWEHALDLDIKMMAEGYFFPPGSPVATYGQFGFEVTKDKAGGCPGGKGSIRFWLSAEGGHPVGDSDDLAIVMSYARELGRREPGTFITDGTGKAALTLYSPFIKSRKAEFARVGECEEYLSSNQTIYDDLRERVLAKLMQDKAAFAAVAGKKQ